MPACLLLPSAGRSFGRGIEQRLCFERAIPDKFRTSTAPRGAFLRFQVYFCARKPAHFDTLDLTGTQRGPPYLQVAHSSFCPASTFKDYGSNFRDLF